MEKEVGNKEQSAPADSGEGRRNPPFEKPQTAKPTFVLFAGPVTGAQILDEVRDRAEVSKVSYWTRV